MFLSSPGIIMTDLAHIGGSIHPKKAHLEPLKIEITTIRASCDYKMQSPNYLFRATMKPSPKVCSSPRRAHDCHSTTVTKNHREYGEEIRKKSKLEGKLEHKEATTIYWKLNSLGAIMVPVRVGKKYPFTNVSFKRMLEAGTKNAKSFRNWTCYTPPNLFGPKVHNFANHMDHFCNFV